MNLKNKVQEKTLAQYLKASLILGLSFMIFFAFWKAWYNFIAPSIFLMGIMISWGIKNKNPFIASIIFLSVLFLAPAYCTFFTGGPFSPLIIWLLPTGMMSNRLLGDKASIIFTISSLITIFLLIIFRNDLIPFDEFNESTSKMTLLFLSSSSAILLNSYFGYEMKNQVSIQEDLIKKQHSFLETTTLISYTDLNGVIQNVNDLFCSTSKYSKDELVDNTHSVVSSGTHPKKFWEDYWNKILAGEVFKGEICNRAKDGTLYWIETSNFPQYNERKQIIGFAAVSVDITEKKLAQKEREKILQTKSEFLANMSHEIRTPMNGILGMVTLLGETKLSSEQDEMLKIVKSCGDGLMTILNDILDYSKIEAGKVSLEIIAFDLRKMINEVLYLSSFKASQKGIELISVIEDATPKFLYGDVTRIRQILMNFVSNAAKFTEKGKIVIEVKSIDVKADIHDIKFSVIDSGIGISPENQKQLFKPFSQADSSITRKFGGTGLGLTIIAKLSKIMGGKIGVESNVGKGSNFNITLSLKRAEQEHSIKSAVGDSYSKEELDLEISYHKILVVEDNNVNQKIAKMMLKKLGFSCDVVGNGLECLEQLKLTNGNDYTLIFMDMKMPEMDGITATKKIIEKYGDNRPLIVATTANVFKSDKELCFKAGMDDFIPKPIRIIDLKRILITYGNSYKKIAS